MHLSRYGAIEKQPRKTEPNVVAEKILKLSQRKNNDFDFKSGNGVVEMIIQITKNNYQKVLPKNGQQKSNPKKIPKSGKKCNFSQKFTATFFSTPYLKIYS